MAEFHESYRVAVATAAPVFAVASVVAIGQMVDTALSAAPYAGKWRGVDQRSVRRTMLESYLYAVLSALLDVTLLMLALRALAAGRDVISRYTILLLVAIAVLLLILQVLANLVARAMSYSATNRRPKPSPRWR